MEETESLPVNSHGNEELMAEARELEKQLNQSQLDSQNLSLDLEQTTDKYQEQIAQLEEHAKQLQEGLTNVNPKSSSNNNSKRNTEISKRIREELHAKKQLLDQQLRAQYDDFHKTMTQFSSSRDEKNNLLEKVFDEKAKSLNEATQRLKVKGKSYNNSLPAWGSNHVPQQKALLYNSLSSSWQKTLKQAHPNKR